MHSTVVNQPLTQRRDPRPLAGISVLDLTRLLPGGLCSLILADLGAAVTKVESPAGGDYARWMEPRVDGPDPSTASPSFVALNRGKRSIALDLKRADSRDAFVQLVRHADVLLESFRPGVMERLGLGYEALAAENPGLIYCAVTGYGQDGSAAGRAGHDINYLAASGVLALSGLREAPTQAGVQIADVAGGSLTAACSILAALRQRDASGEGQFIDVSMTHAVLSFLTLVAADALATGVPARREAELLNGGVVCYRPYRCADGWVTIGALEPKFWAAWCRGVGREDLIAHQFDGPTAPSATAVAEVFARRTRAEWEAFNTEHDCCVEAVQELEETLQSPLVRERGMLVEVRQPGSDQPLTVLGPPVRTSADPPRDAPPPAPRLGEHTVEVLAEAGLDDAEIERLLQAEAAGSGNATH